MIYEDLFFFFRSGESQTSVLTRWSSVFLIFLIFGFFLFMGFNLE